MVFWIWDQNQRQQSENEQMGLYHITKLLHSKEIVNKMEKQAAEWEENICKSSDKGLITKISKELR